MIKMIRAARRVQKWSTTINTINAVYTASTLINGRSRRINRKSTQARIENSVNPDIKSQPEIAASALTGTGAAATTENRRPAETAVSTLPAKSASAPHRALSTNLCCADC